MHEDSSPWATTRQRNTKDPYDLISSNSKIRAFWRRETTGRHEFTARRLAELSLGARRAGRGFEPSSSALRAPGPRRTPCVKYDSCAIIYLSSRNVCEKLHTELQLHAARRDFLRLGPEVVHLDRGPVPRSWIFARRLGATLTRDAVELLRLLGVLAALVLGIVLGVVIIGEKGGRDASKPPRKTL